MTERTWSDDGARRAYEAMADRLTFVGSEATALMVVDDWSDPERPGEAQLIVTVRPGVTSASAQPFLPQWAALAWETDPAKDPRARLMEALLEGHLRARERMSGEDGLARLPRQ